MSPLSAALKLILFGGTSSASGAASEIGAPSTIALHDDDDDGASNSDHITSVNTDLRLLVGGLLAVAQNGDELRVRLDDGGAISEFSHEPVAGDDVTITIPGPIADGTYEVSAFLKRGAVEGDAVFLSPDLQIITAVEREFSIGSGWGSLYVNSSDTRQYAAPRAYVAEDV